MLTILAVGEDLDLLRTRADVLRCTGATVLCSTGAKALQFIAERDFDLVVLGHSVRHHDAEQMSETVHRKGSRTLILLLLSDTLDSQEYDEIHPDAISFADPNCLVRAVELLEQQRARSLHEPAAKMQKRFPVGKNFANDIATRRVFLKEFESSKAG